MESEQEGWYTDPWGLHEARWISDGVPSRLVRDGGWESYDDPPDTPPSRAWVPVVTPPGSVTLTDIRRAGAAEGDWLPPRPEERIPGAQPHGVVQAPRGDRPRVKSARWISFLVAFLVVIGVYVGGVLSGLWGPGRTDAGTTTTTFNARADDSAGEFAAGSQAVQDGCSAIGRLTSDLSQDEGKGAAVPSEAALTQRDPTFDAIAMIERANAVPQYSGIVSAANTFTTTLQQATGLQVDGWLPVTGALNALTAQCELLGVPTGT
ncbi:MAG TPA: hypothetical protein VMF35_06955 [Acidimicrobiales bacterium]|nr:hypothetical protein [Acidimicrobiales bacterium]